MNDVNKQPERRESRATGHIGGGLLLIAIGIWALLAALDVPWANMERLWPLVLIGGGVASLVSGLRTRPRQPGGVWFGVTAILSGGLFLYVTLGPASWEEMGRLWPWFLVFAGLGWIAAWASAPRQLALLVLGLAALFIGIGAYLAAAGLIAWDPWTQIAQWWPVLLILLGVVYLAQAFTLREH